MKLVEVVLENITGPFEGGGYYNVSSNFDGMGLSAGILQWCFGQGSLQAKLLLPYLKKHGSIDALKIFPEAVMDSISKMNSINAVKSATVHMNDVKGIFKKSYVVKPEWESAWKKFLTLPEVIVLQKAACESIDREAKYLCFKWGLKTTVSYCWMFDILTQNGSLLGLQKPAIKKSEISQFINESDSANRKVWSKINLEMLSEEQVTLFLASYLRAQKARTEYIHDVFARKGTIALGEGIVHGEKFILKDAYSIETSDAVV